MRVHYVYHDFPDSAKNLRFFVKNFPFEKVDSVEISGVSFKHFDLEKIPKSIKITIIDSDIDMVAHYKWLNDQSWPLQNVLLLNSSCIGPINNVTIGDDWIEKIDRLLSYYGIVAPIVEIPPDNLGVKSIEKYKYIQKSDNCIPFAHSYCLFISAKGVNAIIESGVLNKGYSTKEEAIFICERQLTAIVLNNEYSVLSLLRMHVGYDFLNKNNWNYLNFTNVITDTCPEGPCKYFGSNINPYEVIFYKNIRHEGVFRVQERSGIPIEHQDYIEKILAN